MTAFCFPTPLSKLRNLSTFPFARRKRPVRTLFSTPNACARACHRVVFLGTPSVAASSLKRIWDASQVSCAEVDNLTFDVVAVVTQPPARVGRKRVLTPSPVQVLAESIGIESVFTPDSARDEGFIRTMRNLQPHLCITAAYGNFLPQAFLDVPSLGTLNIHPSLLPKFRGAAPVPRALEAGVTETGVTVAFTDLKMDSGPIVVQRHVALNGTEQTPDLLGSLFDLGTEALISALPSVFAGEAALSADKQNDMLASQAPKLTKDEARVTFTENAVAVHNKVRALAGWPGTWADFVVVDPDTGKSEDFRLKILRSEVVRPEGGMCFGVHEVSFSADGEMLAIVCDDGSLLGISMVQPPGKKPMSARSFWNGLQGRKLDRKRLPH